MSLLRPSGDRNDAGERLPDFLRLQGLRRDPEAKARRLLRILLLRRCALSADPAGAGPGGGRFELLRQEIGGEE
jgi:hypothetical protein